jgi:hypothetical protein
MAAISTFGSLQRVAYSPTHALLVPSPHGVDRTVKPFLTVLVLDTIKLGLRTIAADGGRQE